MAYRIPTNVLHSEYLLLKRCYDAYAKLSRSARAKLLFETANPDRPSSVHWPERNLEEPWRCNYPEACRTVKVMMSDLLRSEMKVATLNDINELLSQQGLERWLAAHGCGRVLDEHSANLIKHDVYNLSMTAFLRVKPADVNDRLEELKIRFTKAKSDFLRGHYEIGKAFAEAVSVAANLQTFPSDLFDSLNWEAQIIYLRALEDAQGLLASGIH